MSNTNQLKTCFIQGRPAAHPSHQLFANSIHAEFQFVDHYFRWQDKSKSIFYQIFSWFVCAWLFPNRKKYNFFLVDNLHFMPVIMKKLFLRKDQKIIVYMGSHTLYFMLNKKFSKWVERAHFWALQNYDAIICEGKMSGEMAKIAIQSKNIPIYNVINGIPKNHILTGNIEKVKSDKRIILFIGHGTGLERMWYKGLDLMFEAFKVLIEKNSNYEFHIVGEWEEEVKKHLLGILNYEDQKKVCFFEETTNLEKYFRGSDLYVHTARGEAYGLTILIALQYGLPALVSNWTGAKEVVEKISKDLIVELDSIKIANSIERYFNLDEEAKYSIGSKCKKIVESYTEEEAKKVFVSTFNLCVQELRA